jgi:hypothetical protein
MFSVLRTVQIHMGLGDGLLKVVLEMEVNWSVYELKSRAFIYILNAYEYKQATGNSIGSLSENVRI